MSLDYILTAMQMKKTTYTALAALLTLLPSCTQDNPERPAKTTERNNIYFRSYLPTITQTRAGVISQDNLSECRVTAINTAFPINPETGEITPYFKDIRFVKDPAGRFIANDGDTCIWPDAGTTLHFFAYYPAVEEMKKNIDRQKFDLLTKAVPAQDGPLIDTRIENFLVARDIADQVDFIAAYSSGTQAAGGSSGIELNFSHQLARIEISAWGASEKYDFEIAGLRIGNPLTQGHFSFSPLMSAGSKTGGWSVTSQNVVEHIFSEGESIVVLSKENSSHTDQDNAASIMGNGGPAMVIPMAEKIEAWEGKADPNIDSDSYTTDKLYFSVLLRVRNRENEIVYPYPNDRNNIPVTYLAVGSDGKVIRQVFLIKGEYYTANEENEDLKYTPAETEEVCGFCWAALPVGAKWEAGKIYSYKLNYTNGIGWQDPEDPNPGEPIIEKGNIPFAVTVDEWVEAEDHDPNIDVPRR